MLLYSDAFPHALFLDRASVVFSFLLLISIFAVVYFFPQILLIVDLFIVPKIIIFTRSSVSPKTTKPARSSRMNGIPSPPAPIRSRGDLMWYLHLHRGTTTTIFFFMGGGFAGRGASTNGGVPVL